MSKRQLFMRMRKVGERVNSVELTDEDVSTGGEGIIARNGIFQVTGRFLLSGLAFECKVLFKWHRHRSLVRSVSIRSTLSLSFPHRYFCVPRLCAVVYGGCPWDKRLHFLIFKCAQTSYPANSLLPMRFTSRFPRG